MILLIHPLPVWPPRLCAYSLPLVLSLQLHKTKQKPTNKKYQGVTPNGSPNWIIESRWEHLFQHQLTNLCKVICFLYFLLSSSFESSRWVFINPFDRTRTIRHWKAGVADARWVFLYYLGLYRQQDSLLVRTLWLWIKILMRGSMYNTAAYALKDRLSGFL